MTNSGKDGNVITITEASIMVQRLWHFITAKKIVHNRTLDSTRILKNLLRKHY